MSKSRTHSPVGEPGQLPRAWRPNCQQVSEAAFLILTAIREYQFGSFCWWWWFFFFPKISVSLFFLIEVQLIYNVVLISAVQQKDSVIHIYVFFFIFCSIMVYPRRSNIVPCAIQQEPCCLSVLNAIVCIYQPQTPSPSLSLPPSPLATTSLFSMSVSLFLFCRQVHLCHILGSTHK